MKRTVVGTALVAVVAVLSGVLVGRAAWGGDDDAAELDRLRVELEDAQDELTVAAQESRRLTGRAERAEHAQASWERTVREMQIAAGISGGSCSVRDVPGVRVRIVSPSDGAPVTSPVLTHLVVDRPVGCDATYQIEVDGVPYQVLGPSDPSSPEPISARNPQQSRPQGSGRPDGTCHSAVYDYVSLDLGPGRHVLSLSGCPSGTEVPRLIPTSVSFRVR